MYNLIDQANSSETESSSKREQNETKCPNRKPESFEVLTKQEAFVSSVWRSENKTHKMVASIMKCIFHTLQKKKKKKGKVLDMDSAED